MKRERLALISLVLPAALSIVAVATASARAEVVYVTLQTSVVRFDLSSGDGTTIAATKTTVATGLSEAMGLVFGGDGNLYVANYSPGTVSRINLGTQAVTSFASGFTNPRGITYSGTGNTFYVANSNSPGSISKVTSGGTVSEYLDFDPTNTAPYGLALDGAGALYSANNASQSLSKIVGGVPSTFATFTPGSGTRGVAVSAAGDIYTAVANGVQKTTAGGSTSTFVASGMGFPFGMAFDSGGNLLVASYTDSKVYAYDSSGTALYDFSTGPLISDRPRYVAFNSPGSGFNQIIPVPEPSMGIAVTLTACAGVLVLARRPGHARRP